MTSLVRIGEVQWIGRRHQQEDSCAHRPFANGASGAQGPHGAIVVLADGMGGHAGGARASALASSTFLQQLGDCRSFKETTGQRLISALDDSNRSLKTEVERSPELQGMGCTLIGCVVDAGFLRWVSVGDSLLFRFRALDGSLEKLNEDHSMAPVLGKAVERGELSADQAASHPQRNALRSALTGGKIMLLDRNEGVELDSGDFVILASDGILTLSPSEIRQVIFANYGQGPQAVAAQLIRAVESKGKPDQDNTSVVVVEYRDTSEEPTVRFVPPANATSSGQRGGLATKAFALSAVAVILGALWFFVGLLTTSSEREPSTAKKPPAGAEAAAAKEKDGAETGAKENGGGAHDKQAGTDGVNAPAPNDIGKQVDHGSSPTEEEKKKQAPDPASGQGDSGNAKSSERAAGGGVGSSANAPPGNAGTDPKPTPPKEAVRPKGDQLRQPVQ